VGSLNTTVGEVFMAENLNYQICVVDGLNAWIYNYTPGSMAYTWTLQTQGALGGTAPDLIPNYVEYHNTFFLFGNANTTAIGAAWYAYSPALGASLGNLTVRGTGVLAATELLINSIDVAGTYVAPQAFVNYINTGVVANVSASLSGSAVTLMSPADIVISTAGTVGANGITFANFSLTGGAKTQTLSSALSSSIAQSAMLALQTKSDFALAVKKLPGQGNNVIVFGSTVCEIHTQVGNVSAQIPYLRNPSRNINYGCLSVATIGDSGDVIAWLAINEEESASIMAFDGQSASRISTDGIDYLLSQLNKPQQSTAILYRIDGHLLYQLTFYDPSDNITLLYDFNTKLFFNLTDQYFNYHPMRGVAYFNNYNNSLLSSYSQGLYFISLNNSALYLMSSNSTFIDENLPPVSSFASYNQSWAYEIPRERITSSIRMANSSRFRTNSLDITLEQGADLYYPAATSGTINFLITETAFIADPDAEIVTETGNPILDEQSGLDNLTPAGPYTATIPYVPRIDLAISLDGGNTWSAYNPRQLHPLGFNQNILTWGNMGVANDLCFKLRFWGLSRFVVNNGLAQVIGL